MFSGICFPLWLPPHKIFFCSLCSSLSSFLSFKFKSKLKPFAYVISSFLPLFLNYFFPGSTCNWILILKFNPKCQLLESPSLTTLLMLSPQLHIMLLCFIQCIYNSLSLYFSLFACLSPALECKLHEIRESRASWKWKSLGRVWLCDPMDCNSPGSSVHGILQAGILEGVAIPSSRGSSQPRDQTRLVHCRQILYHLSQLPPLYSQYLGQYGNVSVPPKILTLFLLICFKGSSLALIWY